MRPAPRDLTRRAPLEKPKRPERDEWVRLKGGNDWGNIYFALNPLNERGMAEFRRGIKLQGGEPVVVRWASGDMGETTIELVRSTYRVGDMGKDYEVTSHVPHVVGSFNGHKILVHVADVEVLRSWAVEHGAQ